jgi:hypothetical protein
MSILDDAIREHLELKRQHGADDAELKKLEDEAFGPPVRPEDALDPFAEAPTEFLATPESGDGEAAAEGDSRGGETQAGRRINVADLQEPPPPLEEEASAVEEEQPAMEHEVVSEQPPAGEPEIDAGPSAEERHAIGEQPTEIFDVEGDFDAGGEAESPSDEELVDAELSEPRLAPVDPIAGIEASAPAEAGAPPSDEEIEEHADEFDEFFSEQRLSEELNQALEAPLEEEHRNFAEEDEGGNFIVEDEENGVEEDDGVAEDEDDGTEEPSSHGHDEEEHEDVLEDTPDFLADDPEDDNLWFEQKPPKDIDFGD